MSKSGSAPTMFAEEVSMKAEVVGGPQPQAGALAKPHAAELQPESESPDAVSMFERLARDPNVDVEKLQRLIDMQRALMRERAEEQFWAAFASLQGELPTINEDGAIVVDGQIRSRYSTNENIQEVIRPILQRHGFSVSFRNTTTEKGLCVTGILAHVAGHKERDTFESKPDSGGRMNDIQRIGSTRSYGARYTTISLLNIVSRAKQDRDDDGETAEPKRQTTKPAPDGYDAWLKHIEDVAEKGMAAFAPAWECSEPAHRQYLMQTAPKLLASIRTKAASKPIQGAKR